ncbi:MAG: hypothetical protein OXE84_04660 [Rhodobacteraceae bacterium]|nr:hypothetical protein [Paracoccaceae bacterium]MCY4195938.1 hypothetical protein [Paracoccaceae bacterium]
MALIASQRIGGDDQASHDGGDGHIVVFFLGDPPVSEFRHLVMSDPGGVGRHSEDITRSSPPAGDVANTGLLTPVTRHRAGHDRGADRLYVRAGQSQRPSPPMRGRATGNLPGYVLDTPPHRVAEVLAGTLHTQLRPASRHVRVSSIFGYELFDPFDRGRGGRGG